MAATDDDALPECGAAAGTGLGEVFFEDDSEAHSTVTLERDDGLVERGRDNHFLYRHWGAAGFGVFCRSVDGGRTGAWRPARLTRPLLRLDGGVHPRWLLCRSLAASGLWPVFEDIADDAQLQASLAEEEARRAAWRRYVEAIPRALRLVAAPLRGAQWDALAAFAADPALAPHVAKEVAAAGPGYIAAAFSLLPPGRRDGAALAAMLGAALRTPRHVFLARLAGRRVGKAEARILSKLDDVVERRAALALIRLAKGEAAPRLRHMPRLRAAAASLLPTLPRAVAAAAAPVVLASPPTGFEEEIRDSLRLLVRRLQRSAPEQIATLCGEIGRAPSLEALNRVAERWVAQTSPVPVRVPHPVPGTRRLVPLTTRAALADAGRRFRNCLRRTTPDDPVYEWRGRRPALVSLVRDANGLWAIGQIAGPENGDVPHRTRQRIAAPLYRQLAGRLAHTKKPR